MAAFLIPILPSMAKTLPYLNLTPPQDSIYNENEVDKMAFFEEDDMYASNYFQKNTIYPPLAIEDRIEGEVIFAIIIDSTGAVTKPIIMTENSCLTKEALRLVTTMPKWKAAQVKGKNVNMRTFLGVKFTLPDSIRQLDAQNKQAIATQDSIDHLLIQKYVAKHKLVGQYTPSGVFYVVENQGVGKKVDIVDWLTVHYQGFLLNGQLFESSYNASKAAQVPLAGTIHGWQQTLPLLNEGGKATVIVPSSLAYAKHGHVGSIPANAVVLFKLEVIKTEAFDYFNKNFIVSRDNYIGPDTLNAITTPINQDSIDHEIITQYISKNKLVGNFTPSGIFYSITEKGNGKKATIDDWVTVSGTISEPNVYGHLLFANSFQLKTAIPGLQRVIPLIEEGSDAIVVIPSSLALNNNQYVLTLSENVIRYCSIHLHKVMTNEEWYQQEDENILPNSKPSLIAINQDSIEHAIIKRYAVDNYLNGRFTSSGMFYQAFDNGNTQKATPDCWVDIVYGGMIVNKTKYSGYDYPAVPNLFPLKDMLPNWQEALLNFKEGDEGVIMVPSSSAFISNKHPYTVTDTAILCYQIKIVPPINTDSLKRQNAIDKEIVINHDSIEHVLIQKYVAEHQLVGNYLSSGVFYAVKKQGNGKKITAQHRVSVDNTCFLLNGDKISSSYGYHTAPIIDLNSSKIYSKDVLLQLNETGEALLILPSALGYGKEGRPHYVPPYAVLMCHLVVNEILPDELPNQDKKATAVSAKSKYPPNGNQRGLDRAIIEKYVENHNLVGRYTKSGIFYAIDEIGTGEKATIDDQIEINYRGFLLNNQTFASSYDQQKTEKFALADVIPAWQEIIPLLKEGTKVTIVTPSHLAYGKDGLPPLILSNAVLAFNIEIVKVIKNK